MEKRGLSLSKSFLRIPGAVSSEKMELLGRGLKEEMEEEGGWVEVGLVCGRLFFPSSPFPRKRFPGGAAGVVVRLLLGAGREEEEAGRLLASSFVDNPLEAVLCGVFGAAKAALYSSKSSNTTRH